MMWSLAWSVSCLQRGQTALELSCPGCRAARKRCAADPGPILYASLWVPGSADQRDRTMLRIAGITLHRVRDTGILLRYARSDTSPSGKSNSKVFSVIETMV